MADSLRDELLSIPGIEAAEFEGDVAAPEGVRVRLSADADSEVVGQEVRRILATHGMRSHLAQHEGDESEQEGSEEPATPPPPPGAPASVVALPGVTPIMPVTRVPEPQPVTLSPEPPPLPVEGAPAPALADTSAAVHRLDTVALEEGRHGVTVRVTSTNGSRVERRARPGGAGLDEAVVSAVGELFDSSVVPPLLIEVVSQEISAVPVVTVMLEQGDGRVCAGSAVSDSGRVYAVARAAWAALDS